VPRSLLAALTEFIESLRLRGGFAFERRGCLVVAAIAEAIGRWRAPAPSGAAASGTRWHG